MAITTQTPLTRRGTGPGLILLVSSSLPLAPSDKTLDPPPLAKWAEEGFCVAQVVVAGAEDEGLNGRLDEVMRFLGGNGECTGGGMGLVVYTPLPDSTTKYINDSPDVLAVVSYAEPLSTTKPALWHCAGSPPSSPSPNSTSKTYAYPTASPNFVLPSSPNYSPSAASLSHTRSLSFIKPLLHGPYFDLEAIWDEHTYHEFTARDVPATMATMVAQPYVNHIPTLTGGIGHAALSHFYATRFVTVNPDDVALEVVSRTTGIDRVIDEFVFSGTHDRVIDWLLPGVPPTNRRFEIPMTCVVNVRGDRLFHEHIAWDQASLLRQLGLLPDYLPFPYPVEGREGKWEYRLPVAGAETARKLVDERAVESNGMFEYGVREVEGN
ncbi:carboxymethylenebutenolidase [Phyllosticta capitalensis]